jgi:c-di-GMP-binding flagellar brake protein YcgR
LLLGNLFVALGVLAFGTSIEEECMILRIATLNLEQDHKCWEARREIVAAQMAELNPDMLALNEIHIPTQTGRWLQRSVTNRARRPKDCLRDIRPSRREISIIARTTASRW